MTSTTDPTALAAEIAALGSPRLLVFDCDGVLAPIVAHADDARLRPGNAAALEALARADGTTVAVLSGRSLDGLAQFEFPPTIELVGSYGAERRGRDGGDLGSDERELLDQLGEMADAAAASAGDGAWVERKPASVVLHVREADPDSGGTAIRRVRDDAERLHGVYVHDGKSVVELAVHRSDKGTALDALIAELRPASVVYLGDDEPDEAAFEVIARPSVVGLGVRVGPTDETAATRIVEGPASVSAMLGELAAGLGA